MSNIPETSKETTAYQLSSLVQILEEAGYDINTRLSIALQVVENLVDPEIIRELYIITKALVSLTPDFPRFKLQRTRRTIEFSASIHVTCQTDTWQVESDVMHVMETPEAVLLLAQRDIDDERSSAEYATKKRSEALTFRDALLNRLAIGRARRMMSRDLEEVSCRWRRGKVRVDSL